MRGGDRGCEPTHNKLTLLSGDHYCSAHKRPSRKSFSPKARAYIWPLISVADKQMTVCDVSRWLSHSATCESHSSGKSDNSLVSVSAWMKVQFVNHPLSRDKGEREHETFALFIQWWSCDPVRYRQTRLSDSEHTVKDLSH